MSAAARRDHCLVEKLVVRAIFACASQQKRFTICSEQIEYSVRVSALLNDQFLEIGQGTKAYGPCSALMRRKYIISHQLPRLPASHPGSAPLAEEVDIRNRMSGDTHIQATAKVHINLDSLGYHPTEVLDMGIPGQHILIGIQFLEGLGVGSFGGFISGLLGITAGGVLVPALVIILGFSQHRAQALSLTALLPPTSISGVLQYRRRGHEIPLRNVTLLALAFLAGSFCGASIASVISDRPLRWMYVGYLVLLALLLILRHNNGLEPHDREKDIVSSRSETIVLLIIGLIAGISSGLLGIGGGLVITVGMVGMMNRTQHQAQALSLAVCLLPTGLPGVWVYISRDPHFPWILLIGLVLGLLLGTSAGARAATKLKSPQLRYGLLVLISLNVALMIWKAIKG